MLITRDSFSAAKNHSWMHRIFIIGFKLAQIFIPIQYPMEKIIPECIELEKKSLSAKHFPLCGCATPPLRQPGYFRYEGSKNLWNLTEYFQGGVRLPWLGFLTCICHTQCITHYTYQTLHIVTIVITIVIAIVITIVNTIVIIIFSIIIVIIIKTNMAIITTTCSGQREALPKPSMLSLRIPRTEENGLWPIWKCKDADSFYEGNDGDDLDDNDADYEEGDGFAGGFLSILNKFRIIF